VPPPTVPIISNADFTLEIPPELSSAAPELTVPKKQELSHEPEKIAKLEQEVNKLEKFKYGGLKPWKKEKEEEKKYQKVFKVSREEAKIPDVDKNDDQEEEQVIYNPTEETKSTLLPTIENDNDEDNSNLIVKPKTQA